MSKKKNERVDSSKVKITVFLSYAHADLRLVSQLYQKLRKAGFNPWMDKPNIVGGEDWQRSIYKAIQQAHFFLVCLSRNSVDRRGNIQREILAALDVREGMLPQDIYLIPLRIEECECPERLCGIQYVDLFAPNGFSKLIQTLRVGVERRGITPMATNFTSDDQGSRIAEVAREQAVKRLERDENYRRLRQYLNTPKVEPKNVITEIAEFFDLQAIVLLRQNGPKEWDLAASNGIDSNILEDTSRFVVECCPKEVWAEGKILTSDCSLVEIFKRNPRRFRYSLWCAITRRGILIGLLGLFRGSKKGLFEINDQLVLTEIRPLLADIIQRTGQILRIPVEDDEEQIKELERILYNREIQILFQPVVSLWNGKIAGYEALARGPEDSSLYLPDRLFKYAKIANCAERIALLCFERALDSIRKAEIPDPGALLFLNILPSLLSQNQLRNILANHKNWIRPWNVILEIVEMPADGANLVEDAADLVRCGFHLAEDDHGIGGATDMRLIQMKPRFTKIPREIIKGTNERGVQEIVKGFIKFAEQYGGTMVAEGIETMAELKICYDIGIRFVQGFGLARPSPVLLPALPHSNLTDIGGFLHKLSM